MRLSLIQTQNGLLLERNEPGEELEYYDLDGEGGPATKTSLTPWNEEYQYVAGVVSVDYDDDSDSFWCALQTVLESARANGVDLPEYAAY